MALKVSKIVVRDLNKSAYLFPFSDRVSGGWPLLLHAKLQYMRNAFGRFVANLRG